MYLLFFAPFGAAPDIIILCFIFLGDANRLLDFSDFDDQNRICGLAGCAEDSLQGILTAESFSPFVSHIASVFVLMLNLICVPDWRSQASPH